jgi:hypothetical protein
MPATGLAGRAALRHSRAKANTGLSMRHFAMSCVLLLGAAGAVQAQQARLPASHDMTQFAGGKRFEATYKRMAPFPIYAPMKAN